MGKGREMPILTSTPAIVGIGNTSTNAKSIVPKSNFFILLPPLSDDVIHMHLNDNLRL
jgi:hypothetical protein